jgi:hypothetical protein
MTSDGSDAEGTNSQSIPEARQDISVDEITDVDYEVVDPSQTEDRGQEEDDRTVWGPTTDPGRTHNTDSIEASSENLGEDDAHDAYSFEYESPAATRIGNDDETDERAEKLKEHHDERHHIDDDFASRVGEQHKERTAQALCSSLPVTDSERELVVQTVKALDFDEFGQHGSIPKVTLGVVAVVVDEQERDLDSFNDAVSRSEPFRDECDSLDISMSDMSSIKQSVREVLDDAKVVAGPSHPRRDPLLPGPTSPKDRPDEYWGHLSPDEWERIAGQWDRLSTEFKEAIPSQYHSRIEALRAWEPWNRWIDDVPGDELESAFNELKDSTAHESDGE